MLRFFFKKWNRLLRSRDFRLCAQHGEERTGRFMIIQFRKTATPDRKLGLIVSRKYGKASKRNRFKRLMREVFRRAQHALPSHLHVTVRPRSEALNASFAAIHDEFLELLRSSTKSSK